MEFIFHIHKIVFLKEIIFFLKQEIILTEFIWMEEKIILLKRYEASHHLKVKKHEEEVIAIKAKAKNDVLFIISLLNLY